MRHGRPVSARARAWSWVLAAYLAALAAGGAAALAWAEAPLLGRIALADLAATLVVFGFATALRNSSVYDPYWSVAPVVIAAALVFGVEGPAPVERQALVLAAITVYGARLTWNWARGWRGLAHEDWRYVQLREKTGRAFPLVNLLGIMLLPTALVYLGVAPLVPALVHGDADAGRLDGLAAAVVLLGTALEATADRQLRRFAETRPHRAAVMDQGLWAWSRHPNYLGELLVWVGCWLFGLASGALAPWMAAGPLAMVALFLGISIPMMERRQRATKPGYAAYAARTPVLLPWPLPPRARGSAGGRSSE
jgi:steroid 5-alpha reductase family enzyme